MKHQSSHSQELRAFKDRVKYYIVLKQMLSAKVILKHDETKAEVHKPEPTQNKSVLQQVMDVSKTLYHITPEWVFANAITSIGFKLMSKVVDRLIVQLKNKVKPNLELFEGEIPSQFEFEYHAHPTVSIVIPVHNKYHYTHKCLYSILKHSGNISYQIIIGDDASTDKTATIQDRIKHIDVSTHNPGLGFLRNCNTASKLARGKYILFLNNDTVVQPGWLEALVQTIESADNIGMVGSKLVYPDGLLQEAGGIIFSNAEGWNYGRLSFPEAPEYNYVKEVDYISGASIMLHKWLWDQLGGFDERYVPAYYEDSDLAFEVRKAGLKVLYQPKSVVVHFEGISHGTDTGSGIKEYQVKNKVRFFDKWKDVLEAQQSKGPEDLFVARDRSAQRKTMLVIDHYVPEYDKDAGSKSTFQYLNLFLELGLNVKFLGDNFMQTEPYTSALQQRGIEVLYGYEYESGWRKWIMKHADHLDYVFINRPHVAEKYIYYIKQHTNARIIYYGHDLHFLREERQYKIEQNKELLKSAKRWKQKEISICKQADVVLYPSAVETEILLKEFPELPAKTLPLNCYEQPTGSKLTAYNANKKDLLFVGGFNHPPNVDAIIWFCQSVLPLVAKKLPEISISVVGSNATPEVLALSSKHILIKGYVSDEELARLYDETRIVIAPLRYGAGVKGKVVEALYYRNPVVTTPVGAEGINTSTGEIKVAETAEALASEIIRLYNNENELREIFDRCPDYIKKFYSMDSQKNFVRKELLGI